MSLQKFVKVSVVNDLLKKGIINKEGVRILDCSYTVGEKMDWKKYKEELYGKFDRIDISPSPSKKLYLMGHIPKAVHMNLDNCMYPSKYERFTMYPPELFEQCIQLLGVNKGEHLIFYARGALGGMLFASRCAWLFKSYGHDKLSVIDGGFAQWEKAGYEVSQEDVRFSKGNWKAKDCIDKYNVKFEDLPIVGENKEQKFEKTDETNYFDARGRGQFEGSVETGLDGYRVGGSNIPGFKNLPANELLTNEGSVKNNEEIKQWLSKNNYDTSKPVVTNCNTGLQASFLAYAIHDLVNKSPRLYNGSIKELEIRAPKVISGGRSHLPH